MFADLDRYYTPKDLAERMISDSVTTSPVSCVDTTCGAGHLLEAASRVFGEVECIGLDRDKNTIMSLRRKNPHWVLSVADLMKPNSYKRTTALSEYRACDLLLLNPPFSHGNRKAIDITYNGHKLKGSIAMAHIMRSFELFNPSQGAVVIVPESVLYSETDAKARRLLGHHYSIEKVAELENTTFKGASVHATIVRIVRGKSEKDSKSYGSLVSMQKLNAEVTRGGLAVHQMNVCSTGVPFIHSTDIRKLVAANAFPDSFMCTNSVKKGRLSGWVVLIPRVGVPDKALINAVFIPREVQLSDCVIALQFTNKQHAEKTAKRIKSHWEDFHGLYRGTGARYVTLSRLQEWLLSMYILQHQQIMHL